MHATSWGGFSLPSVATRRSPARFPQSAIQTALVKSVTSTPWTWSGPLYQQCLRCMAGERQALEDIFKTLSLSGCQQLRVWLLQLPDAVFSLCSRRATSAEEDGPFLPRWEISSRRRRATCRQRERKRRTGSRRRRERVSFIIASSLLVRLLPWWACVNWATEG